MIDTRSKFFTYHPQKMVKLINWSLSIILRYLVSDHNKNRNLVLLITQFSYNSLVNCLIDMIHLKSAMVINLESLDLFSCLFMQGCLRRSSCFHKKIRICILRLLNIFKQVACNTNFKLIYTTMNLNTTRKLEINDRILCCWQGNFCQYFNFQ
jgi:hypothetical protein